MVVASPNKTNWSPAEKALVEQLYFDKWSPSGIAVQVFQKFGTDRTREQVNDLIRVSGVINQNVRMEPSQRRVIPRRKAIEHFTPIAPMREVVAKVSTALISDHSEARIIQLWTAGAAYDAIAATLELRVGTVVAFVARNYDRCPPRPSLPTPAKRLIDLETCQCRFPNGEEAGETLFCAAVVEPDIWQCLSLTSSYCRTHRSNATAAPRVR